MATQLKGARRSIASLPAVAGGLLLGVLVSVLVLPEPSRTTVAEAGGAASDTAAIGSSGAAPASATGPGGADGAGDAELASPDPDGSSPEATAAAAAAGAPASDGPSDGTPIVLGIPIADFGAVKALGSSYDPGPMEEQFEAVVARWEREGRASIGGHPIELAFRSYDILDPAAQRSACIALTEQDGALAILTNGLFLDGAACTAGEKGIPTISADLFTARDFQSNAPNLYSMFPELDRTLRNTVDWMIANGLTEGHRVGIYYSETRQDFATLIERELIDGLKARGVEPAAVVTTRDGEAGGPTDAVAVQRFRQARVDVALTLVFPLAAKNFQDAAAAQGYLPTYVTNDFNLDTYSSAAAPYSDQAFDGAWALTANRSGEIENGDVTPEAATCMESYLSSTGRSAPPPQSLEHAYVFFNCDLMEIAHAALRNAGGTVSSDSFRAGLQRVAGLKAAATPDQTFGPGKFTGVDAARTIRWHADCECWRAVGAFAPLKP